MPQGFAGRAVPLVLLMALATGAYAAATAGIRVGVVTGASGSDERRGAELAVREHRSPPGDATIVHATWPDDASSGIRAFTDAVLALAEDPDMKAIVVSRAPRGTVDAFRRVREARPDILLLAGEPSEPALAVQNAADLAVGTDPVARGYTIVWAAKQLGARTFVHISHPRHLALESPGRRRAVMERACRDLGLVFVEKTVADPASTAGPAGAESSVAAGIAEWVAGYGKGTAFFCTDDALAPALIGALLVHGGIYVEADLPSPLVGYPRALGIQAAGEPSTTQTALRRVEAALVERGAAGRFGTWAFPFGQSLTAGLVQFAVNVAGGRAKADSVRDLVDALGKYTPGARWAADHYIDPATGVRARNHILLRMDTYVPGRPGRYLPTSTIEVPGAYFTLLRT